MIIKIKNAKVYDPINKVNGKIKNIYIKNGRIANRLDTGDKIRKTIDLKRKIVMPGGIDIHSHISAGNINLARLL